MIERRGKDIMREHKFIALHKEQERMSEQLKHDGKLGKHEVSFWQEFVIIEEADGLRDEPEYVQLTAEQALSLLAWLVENKPVIEQLAKENNTSTD